MLTLFIVINNYDPNITFQIFRGSDNGSYYYEWADVHLTQLPSYVYFRGQYNSSSSFDWLYSYDKNTDTFSFIDGNNPYSNYGPSWITDKTALDLRCGAVYGGQQQCHGMIIYID